MTRIINIKYTLAVCALVFVISCGTLSGCVNDKAKSVAPVAKVYGFKSYNSEEIASGVIAENDAFSLVWDNDGKCVSFKDVMNKAVYSQRPFGFGESQRFDENGMPIKNNPMLESAINVSYYDPKSATEGNIYSSIASVKEGNVYAELIDNGIRVIYDFSEKKITVPVCYTISNDCFNITVEASEISEDELLVTGVAIAPFMCGIKNDEQNGYLFVPDGSGAIIIPKTIDNTGSNGSIPVYGGDYSRKDDEFESYKEQCYIPVFGMKAANNGLCAIIKESAERSYINWSVGASNLQYSSVYPYFRIRGYDNVKSPIGIVGWRRLTFNQYISDEPLSVSYYPISGEACGYNDMAEIYRNYLIKKYAIKEKNNIQTNISLEIEGGITEKKFFCGIPYTGFTPLTTVKQAQEIAEFFKPYTKNMLVRLCGFTETGLDIGKVGGGFKINPELAEKGQVSDIISYCDKSGIALSLDFDLISFNKNGNGFSIKNSATLFSNIQTGYIDMFDEVTRNTNNTRIYLLKRSLVQNAVKKAVDKCDDYGFKAIGMGKFGKFIYSDFANAETFNCNGIQEDVIKYAGDATQNKKVVMTGANDYAIGACDYVVGAPTASSGYDVFDYDIPFYSMIFKNYVSMSSGAINLAANTDTAVLRCIEAGISPTYTLLYDFSRGAVDSKYPATRSSEFDSVKENIAGIIKNNKKFYDRVSCAQIIKHEIVSEELRKVTYDNNTVVYVNYGDESITVDGVTVEAGSYAISEG